MPKFTVKQQRYVDRYDGDIKTSAKAAGISYQYAKELHTKTYYAHVLEAIQKREEKRESKAIASREERQEFWTKVMKGEYTETVRIIKDGNYTTDDVDMKMSDRLKASELLGKSEADFITKIEGGLNLLGNLEEKQRAAEERVNGGSG